MTRFAIVLLGLTSLASTKPTFLSLPWTYTTPSIPSTQVGINGEVLNGPEVDERTTGLANGAARSAIESRLLQGRQSLIRDNASQILTSSAPLGPDGRVVDTPEVTIAKAAHAAAHVHERINLANEIARSGDGALDLSNVVSSSPNSGVLGAPEVAVNGNIDLANEALRSGNNFPRVVNNRVVPLVLGNGVIAALVSIDSDDRPLDLPKMTAHGEQNLENDVRSVDALAVVGPALAYGRLVY